MENWPGATVGVAYALTGVSFFIIFARNALRRLKHEEQLPDDYIMLSSVILYAVVSATNPIAYYNGTNVRVKTPSKLSPEELQRAVLGSTYIIVGKLFYVTYIWTLKACMLIFYHRTIEESTVKTIALKGVAVILGISWLASIFTVFLGCDPLEKYWQIYPETPECVQGVASIVLTGTIHIFTNVLLMLLPIPAIIRAEFPLRSILQVAIVFAANFFVIIIVVIRMIIVERGLTQWQAQDLIWRQVECFAMTMVVNMPVFYRVWRHGFNHFRKGKFGQDECSTGYTPPVENQPPRAEFGRSDNAMSRLGDNLRISAAKISAKARRSVGLQLGQIEWTIELIQTRNTQQFTDTAADAPTGIPIGMDIGMFGGHGIGANDHVAHINTTITRADDIGAKVARGQKVSKKMKA